MRQARFSMNLCTLFVGARACISHVSMNRIWLLFEFNFCVLCVCVVKNETNKKIWNVWLRRRNAKQLLNFKCYFNGAANRFSQRKCVTLENSVELSATVILDDWHSFRCVTSIHLTAQHSIQQFILIHEISRSPSGRLAAATLSLKTIFTMTHIFFARIFVIILMNRTEQNRRRWVVCVWQAVNLMNEWIDTLFALENENNTYKTRRWHGDSARSFV